MSTRWWFPFDGMEEMMFKRAPEGYVYRAPNPWLFVGGKYYLLNEQQKTEIAARHRRVARYLRDHLSADRGGSDLGGALVRHASRRHVGRRHCHRARDRVHFQMLSNLARTIAIRKRVT